MKQGGALSLLNADGWKYIKPNNGNAYNALVDIELGNSKEQQLYNLNKDLGEKNNIAPTQKQKAKMMASKLEEIIKREYK